MCQKARGPSVAKGVQQPSLEVKPGTNTCKKAAGHTAVGPCPMLWHNLMRKIHIVLLVWYWGFAHTPPKLYLHSHLRDAHRLLQLGRGQRWAGPSHGGGAWGWDRLSGGQASFWLTTPKCPHFSFVLKPLLRSWKARLAAGRGGLPRRGRWKVGSARATGPRRRGLHSGQAPLVRAAPSCQPHSLENFTGQRDVLVPIYFRLRAKQFSLSSWWNR